MKKAILLLFLITVGISISGCTTKNTNTIDNKSVPDIDVNTSPSSIIPSSVDKYYENNSSEYLDKMYELDESMQAIIVNINQGKNKNMVDNSIKRFSEEYRNSSTLVPEWVDYYDVERLDRLNSADYSQTLSVLSDINDACTDCHREIKSAVWAKYHWKDIRDLKMDTINGTDDWISAKNILQENFDGIFINIAQNDKANAINSFNDFKKMYNNMVETCTECHPTKPDKYIENNSIDILEKDINSNINDLEKIREDIRENCYTCHIIHETNQRIKELEEPR